MQPQREKRPSYLIEKRTSRGDLIRGRRLISKLIDERAHIVDANLSEEIIQLALCELVPTEIEQIHSRPLNMRIEKTIR